MMIYIGTYMLVFVSFFISLQHKNDKNKTKIRQIWYNILWKSSVIALFAAPRNLWKTILKASAARLAVLCIISIPVPRRWR